jgi:hypothetical protein
MTRIRTEIGLCHWQPLSQPGVTVASSPLSVPLTVSYRQSITCTCTRLGHLCQAVEVQKSYKRVLQECLRHVGSRDAVVVTVDFENTGNLMNGFGDSEGSQVGLAILDVNGHQLTYRRRILRLQIPLTFAPFSRPAIFPPQWPTWLGHPYISVKPPPYVARRECHRLPGPAHLLLVRSALAHLES